MPYDDDNYTIFGGGDAQSGEPPVMPWDYHEDPIAWLNRRAAEMYRREEA